MDKEIKKRKKRFRAFCLALVLVLTQVWPVSVSAAVYRIYADESNEMVIDAPDSLVVPGDEVNYDSNRYNVPSTTIIYLDDSSSEDSEKVVLGEDSMSHSNTTTETKSFTVKSYSDFVETEWPEEAFKGWSVSNIIGSSGCLASVALTATWYNKSNINYVLNGGENADTNPAVYYEGKETITLADATKTGYSFEGWYLEDTFTTKVTSISPMQTGDITLYAKFTAREYTITYVLNGGTNGAGNPVKYTYGEGVSSFADATKAGYKFDGWYSDAAFTTKVTAISATATDNITLYAKFTAREYTITYVLNGGTNGAGNPAKYTCGTGVSSFADATKTGYRFGGWYREAAFSTKVTSISTTQTGDITLYAKFTKVQQNVSEELKAGVGTIRVADIHYGKTPSPVVASSTNGTGQVTIEYKKKGAADSSYTKQKPVQIGTYTARATFPETKEYQEVIATTDFTIRFLDAPASPYEITGTRGEDNYFISAVTILPANGYLIADSLDGSYKKTLEISETLDDFSVYLMKEATGEKTAGIPVNKILIDTEIPVILKVESMQTAYDENSVGIPVENEEIIYGENAGIIIQDDNLKQVLVNNEPVIFENGKAVLTLYSNQGEEEYDITGIDIAGNKKNIRIVVAAEWMKTKVVPPDKKVRLYSKYGYNLGNGKWNVTGDNTTYSGNIQFYINSNGQYSFSNTN